MLFKGFTQIDLLERDPRFLCAVLAEQLTLTNKALEAQNEEIKQLRLSCAKAGNVDSGLPNFLPDPDSIGAKLIKFAAACGNSKE